MMLVARSAEQGPLARSPADRRHIRAEMVAGATRCFEQELMLLTPVGLAANV